MARTTRPLLAKNKYVDTLVTRKKREGEERMKWFIGKSVSS